MKGVYRAGYYSEKGSRAEESIIGFCEYRRNGSSERHLLEERFYSARGQPRPNWARSDEAFISWIWRPELPSCIGLVTEACAQLASHRS